MRYFSTRVTLMGQQAQAKPLLDNLLGQLSEGCGVHVHERAEV